MDVSLGAVEARFADMIWQMEPVSSTQLWKASGQTLGWKKSTTFTVLKRLCEKGIFRNESGVVTSLISREGFYALQSQRFVADTFQGSLPAFVAAFTSGGSLSREDVQQLRKMLDEYQEG